MGSHGGWLLAPEGRVTDEDAQTISDALATYGVEHERFEGHSQRHYVRYRGEPMGLMSAHEAMTLLKLLRTTEITTG